MDFQVNLPSKKSFKFNEVSSLLNVKPYVLRFWETEFPQINTQLSEDGTKIYGPESLRTVEKIKELLFEQKLSIPEAKSWLDSNPNLEPPVAPDEVLTALEIKEALVEEDQSLDFSSKGLDGHERLSASLDNILKTINHIIEKNKWS